MLLFAIVDVVDVVDVAIVEVMLAVIAADIDDFSICFLLDFPVFVLGD